MVEAMVLAVDPRFALRWDEHCRELGELMASSLRVIK